MDPWKHNLGFTLAEIMVVIIIIGVAVSLILPRFTGTLERVRASEGIEILTALLKAQTIYQLENGAYSVDPALLDIEIDKATNFDLPPAVDNPADPVANNIAEITRTNSYTLGINENGTICCTDAADPDFTCAEAGIDTCTIDD